MKINSSDAALLCIKISILVALIVSFSFWDELGITVLVVWVFVYPLALILSFIFGTVSAMLGATLDDEMEEEDDDVVDFKPDFDAEEDDSKLWLSEEDLERSETIVGTFQNEPIHEWVSIKNPDNDKECLKLYWDRVVHFQNGEFEFTPPEKLWWIVVMPGLLYIEPKSTVESDAK